MLLWPPFSNPSRYLNEFAGQICAEVSMAVALSFAPTPTTTGRSSGLRHITSRPSSKARLKMDRLRCSGENSSSNSPSVDRKPEPENAVLKAAWYSSELLGIAASFFRQPAVNEPAQKELEIDLPRDSSGVVDRSLVAETIRQDYARSYFVTGNLSLNAYEEDCEFADPAGSFKGLRRFKRNCTNFGSLLEKSNMKLMRWEDSEDRSIGHWRFSCILIFPWRPILSATGYTEYFFDARSGKVCRHVEHWNVPKMVLLKQILKPSRWSWSKNSGS